MGKHKEEIKAPLQLLLPEAICDYFESVHTELSDQDVHLFFGRAAYAPEDRSP